MIIIFPEPTKNTTYNTKIAIIKETKMLFSIYISKFIFYHSTDSMNKLLVKNLQLNIL